MTAPFDIAVIRAQAIKVSENLEAVRMKFKMSVAFMVCALASSLTHAENTYTAPEANGFYQISEVTPWSVDPFNGDWSGNTQVKFTSTIAWIGGSGCDVNSVAIRAEDKNILAVVMQAFAMTKSIRLYADDSKRIGTTCYLRALSIK